MAQAERSSINLCPLVRVKCSSLVFFRVLLYALFHIAQANKQAFIQTDTILEVFHFGDESLLQREPEIDITYHQKSSSLQRGNSRPIRFEPSMLDFHEQSVGMPKIEKVYLHNSSPEEISLISISATTAHFHASFFENRIILPGGNTSFDVVFLARVVGNVENTLFINTSHHGVFTYQVFGVGIPNPYRLRPFIGARVPVNSSFSPLINIHNPHSEPLQVVEMYSSGGDLHLELPTGQQGGTHNLWEIPPFETKGVMRASFSSRDADNHTAFIRIKTNASDPDQFIILPMEVEVTSAPGIYSSIEMLDFGTLRSQDKPKQLNVHLLNSGTKDVQITSVRATPSNDAITIDFKGITLKAGENRYTKVASIHFDASKVQKQTQSSGKITVKAKEKNYSKLEIPYQAEVLDGFLGFDHTVTLFHIRDSVIEPVVKPIHLTNTFHFAIHIHDVALPEEASTMFKVQNFSEPVLIPPHASRYVFSLHFRPVRPSTHIDSNILLVTNASKFHLPVRAYTGLLEPLVLPPSLHEHLLDFGILSATDTSSLLFAVVNSNPIELVLQPWLVTGENLNVELLKIERGNRTTMQAKSRELQNTTATSHQTVILASGYYAVFRVTLVAKDLEGAYDGAVHITTDYEILTVPVRAVIAVGTLTSYPKHIVLPPSFPGKVVHQSFSIVSSFSQRVRLLQIRSLTEDKRLYYRRLKTSRDELEPKRKSKVANIYFDPSLQCGEYCYVGVPFVLKSEARPSRFTMQEDMWDSDVDLYQMLHNKWKELQEVSGNLAEGVFEANADLQKVVQAKISAQLTWPSIINSSRQLLFPLTSINSSSEMEVILENTADVPVYVQILPLALYPNLSAVTHKLAQMFPLERLPHFNPNTLEFQINRNNKSFLRSSEDCREGFREGSTQPYVYNLPLLPEQVKSLRVKFSPVSNHTVTSLLIVRNNLTVVEFLVVQGQGSYERLRLGGKSPGPGGFLRFKMAESHLKECTDKTKSKEPNFTLRRSFKIENTGQLLIDIQSIEINKRACEGFGFKVLSCQGFALKPNSSKDIVILFTPDFTASRVIRELKLVTAGGSNFVFSLNASLPYHMLASCAATLPRPNWELELYVIISVIMSSMFLLVVVTAYLEALGIWEMFKRRLCYETSSNSMETGKPFDLREIVRLQNDAHLNDYGEANHSSLRGTPNPASRAGSRHSRGGPSRAPNQPALPFTQPGSKGSENTPSPCQMASRKTRSARQPQQSPGSPEIQTPSTAVPPAPLQGHLEGAQQHSSEEQDYISLVEAMDKDLNRPEATAEDVVQEQTSVLIKANGMKGKLQRKPKTQKRKEERETRTKGRTQGEELAREDNDDTSSTTTETSNPDTEELNNKKSRFLVLEKDKEETTELPSKCRNKKPANTKEKSQNDAKSSSLELPYVTPLENKRKSFNNKTVLTQTLTNTSPTAAVRPVPPKPRASVPCGKLEDLHPSPLAKFLSNESSSSGSEGEKDTSPPPEWYSVPLFQTNSAVDSLQQISMQTMNADMFLKRPTGTPPPLLSSLSSCDPYSASGGSASEAGLKAAPGNKCKLTKSVSLPGQNGNPTFAAVAAGYDKSPGGSSAGKAAVSRPDMQGKNGLPHMISVESDCSDSSEIWNPIGNGRSPSSTSVNSFSAFGSSNTFNLSGVFPGLTSGRAPGPQQSWPDFSQAPTSSGSVWPSEPLQPWPCSSSSPATPTTSILGSSSLWSSTPPFSPSIWSTSADSTPLHSFTPPTASPLPNLMGGSDNDSQSPVRTTLAQNDLSPTYNPWNMWRPTLCRRSSEPWPNSSDGNPK